MYGYGRTLNEYLWRSWIHSTNVIVHLHGRGREVSVYIGQRSQQAVRRSINVHGVATKFESASISAR